MNKIERIVENDKNKEKYSVSIYYDIDFNKNIVNLELGNHSTNWPVTYVLYNKTESCAYVGETTNFKNRMLEHLETEKKSKFTKVLFVDYSKATKSTILYLEAFLIRVMSLSGEYFDELINIKSNSNRHIYYNQENDIEMCKLVWNLFKDEIRIAKSYYDDILLKNEFKYSPYIALNENQNEVLNDIIFDLITKENNMIVVNGESGTGKTAVAIQLFKIMTEYSNLSTLVTEDMVGMNIDQVNKIYKEFSNNDDKYKIAYVAPMKNLCTIIRKSIKKVSALKKVDLENNNNAINEIDLENLRVYSGNDLCKMSNYVEKDKPLFDLIIVDEAHRLNRRYNLSNGNNYNHFDEMNEKLGLQCNKNKNDGNQLDWIIKMSKNQVFFYDNCQSIRSSDIPRECFDETFKNATYKKLTIQERCSGGQDYISYIKSIFSSDPPKEKKIFNNYDFKMFNDFSEMKNFINNKNDGKSLLASGYFFSKSKKEKIDNVSLEWNSTDSDWVNKKGNENEIGCIHVLGGVDVDYLGIIIGSEIDYDAKMNKIVPVKDNYEDEVGKRCIQSDEELVRYIENIYYILLTRAIKGTYIYVINPEMKKYLNKYVAEV